MPYTFSRIAFPDLVFVSRATNTRNDTGIETEFIFVQWLSVSLESSAQDRPETGYLMGFFSVWEIVVLELSLASAQSVVSEMSGYSSKLPPIRGTVGGGGGKDRWREEEEG